ncbi:MAG: LysR family transcriptional regulator [Ectothiorhodospiraceae bacterium]|nr:LysR family transcriptional regulator [Ectothiorhodospiraceae bacterium]
MDFRQIQYFICLYEEKSVTRAANNLGVVQSALSMQIAKMEREFDLKLFDRTSRGVEPTAEGTSFYQLLLPVMRELEAVRQSMLDLSGHIAGTVRVGMVPSLTGSIAPQVLAPFAQQHPDVHIQLLESYSAPLVEWVDAGVLDFAVVIDPGRQPGLETEKLASEPLMLVTSVDLGAVPPGPCDLSTLTKLKLVLPTSRQGLRGLIDSNLARAGLTVKPRLEIDALGPTLELVRSKQWATILPSVAVFQGVLDGVYQINPIVRPTLSRDLVVVSHRRRPLGLAGRNMCEAIQVAVTEVIEKADLWLKDALETEVRQS